MSEDYFLLKWGCPKGWSFSNPEHRALLQKYYNLGESASAMMQPNTDEHKKVLCELIDSFDGEISNDWDGDVYTKDQAKYYVMNYGKKAT